MVLGTDYFIEDGTIYITPTTTLTSSAAPTWAANVEVSYTRRTQQSLQGLMHANTAYRIRFAGYEMGEGDVDPNSFMVFNAQLKPGGFTILSNDLSKISAEFKLLPLPAMRQYAGYSEYFAGLFGATTV
jgi:hypothetical protein